MKKINYEAPRVDYSEIQLEREYQSSGAEYNDGCSSGCCFHRDDKYQESW